MNSKVKSNASTFVFIILLLAFRWSFADQYHVPTGSMEPTIQVGDRIFVNKMAYGFRIPFTSIRPVKSSLPERGDVVVFDQPVTDVCMVKRVIGLPGDRLEITDGFISINGIPLPGTEEGQRVLERASAMEVYYQEQIGKHQVRVQRIPSYSQPHHLFIDVPQGKVFVMGDNRDNSLDSRSWGFVGLDDIKGQAHRVFFNLSFDDHWMPSSQLQRIGTALN